MNTTEFKTQRGKQLADFQKQYGDLKSEYSTSVINAVKEQDRSKQCILIKQVLDVNKKITALLNSFNSNVDPGTCKSNPELKTRLMTDLNQFKNASGSRNFSFRSSFSIPICSHTFGLTELEIKV